MQINQAEEIEINVVGSSTFGRYPKISLEKTFNMYITDNWLCNYPGFKAVTQIAPSGEGRGIFNSIRGGFLIAVVNAQVYFIGANLVPVEIGSLTTVTGDVTIDENLASQICIVDGRNAYIYNYELETFTQQTLTITPPSPAPPYIFFPNYVCYHNSFFLFGSTATSPNSSSWYAFSPNPSDLTSIVFTTQFTLQTKPDVALAVQRLPGRGNNVLVLGSAVAEVWTQVGGIENYRRVQSFNIDNGLVNTGTLASSEELVCWLGQNENNAPSIMVTDGSSSKRISTDGIDYLLGQIEYPTESSAFFYRQDGHLFYQLTFYNPVDNLTLIHDFATGQFFHVSDENLNYHPARQVVFFNEFTYFTSLNDATLYYMDTSLVTYNYSSLPGSIGQEIPRIRICKTIRRKNSDRMRGGEFTFWIEQGMPNINPPILPRVDMSISVDGGQSFSNTVSRELNPAGVRRNQIRFQRLGQFNELIIQLRFWSFTRIVCQNGILTVF